MSPVKPEEETYLLAIQEAFTAEPYKYSDCRGFKLGAVNTMLYKNLEKPFCKLFLLTSNLLLYIQKFFYFPLNQLLIALEKFHINKFGSYKFGISNNYHFEKLNIFFQPIVNIIFLIIQNQIIMQPVKALILDIIMDII